MKWQEQKIHTYKGAISMGKTLAIIQFIIMILIAFVLKYYGLKLILNRYKEKVFGKVTYVNCHKDGNKYICNLIVRYEVDSQVYHLELSNVSSDYQINKHEWIDVYYQKHDPKKARLDKPQRAVGYILFIVGFIIAVTSIIYLVYIFKYKGLAAVSGVSKVFFH